MNIGAIALFASRNVYIPVKEAIAFGKKIVKVWMMMKEGIFAGHPSLALPPLHLSSLALTFALLALNPLAFAPLHLPLPHSPL